MVMHREFADWYRIAALSPPGELLEQRWQAVSDLGTNLSAEQLIEVLRMYAVRPLPSFKAPEFFDAAFRKHDASFPVMSNAEELRVLAGAVLRNIIETDANAAIATSCGLVCSSFGSRLSSMPNKEHVDEAKRYLARMGTSLREVVLPKISSGNLSAPHFDSQLPAAVFAINQTPALRQPLITALTELAAGVSDLDSLRRTIFLQREELNLLWWLQNAFSRTLRVQFSEIPSSAAVCVFASELFDLTLFVPGPTAILGMVVASLSQTRDAGQPLSIQQILNATPRELRSRWISETSAIQTRGLCPLMSAAAKSLSTEGDSDWIPSYKKDMDVSPEEVHAPTDLSIQLYGERTFIKALSEM